MVSKVCYFITLTDTAKKKHISGFISSPRLVRTLQVLDMYTFGDTTDINSEVKFFNSLQYIRIDSSECMFKPFFHWCQITWQSGYINTIFNVTPQKKSHELMSSERGGHKKRELPSLASRNFCITVITDVSKKMSGSSILL